MADLGLDLSCLDDIDPTGRVVSGRRCLAEALARRVITPRGTLVDDLNYGTDLTAYVNDDIPIGGEGRIAAEADAEFLKDERVVASRTKASLIAGNLTLAAVITDGDGPFSLVLAIGDVTVQLLQPAA